MADILNSVPALPTPAPAPSRDEARSEDLRDSESAGAPVSFAALLKSRSEAAPADHGKDDAAAADGPAGAEYSTAAIVLPLAFGHETWLSGLGQALPPAQDSAATDLAEAAQGSPLVPEALTVTALQSAASGMLDAATRQKAADPAEPGSPGVPETFAAPVASPQVIAGTVSPAPTFGDRPARGAEDHGKAGSPATPFAQRNNTDKLAVEPAISAEPATARATQGGSDAGADFRGALDRLVNQVTGPGMPGASATSAAATPAVHIETGFGQRGWHQEIGEKLTWMAGSGRQQADLVLNPPQLGRIEVTMVVDRDQVTASFVSANPVVRDRLENSIQNLREVLAEAGIALGNTHVGADSRHNAGSMHPDGERHPPGAARRETLLAPMDAMAGAAWRPATGRGMVDIFA